MLRILVANHSLAKVGGTEMFTFTLIEELLRLGHHIEYYTFQKGEISDMIEELGVDFMSKKKYNLILVNHNSCVRFLKKRGFIIQTCHGVFPSLEQPSNDADYHVAISTEVQNHLAILGYNSTLIYNSINLDKFKSTKPINSQVKNVLSLCHSDEAHSLVEECCKELNLTFTKIDKYQNPSFCIEKIINDNDLVIGLGRSLYDAMSCSRPVISYDYRKQYMDTFGDGYIIPKFGFALLNNCSGRYFKIKFNKDSLKDEILKYNRNDGLIAREIIEKEFDVKKNILKYLQIHEQSKKINSKIYLKKIYRKLFYGF